MTVVNRVLPPTLTFVMPGHAPDAAAIPGVCAPLAADPKGWVSSPRRIVALPHLAANSW